MRLRQWIAKTTVLLLSFASVNCGNEFEGCQGDGCDDVSGGSGGSGGTAGQAGNGGASTSSNSTTQSSAGGSGGSTSGGAAGSGGETSTSQGSGGSNSSGGDAGSSGSGGDGGTGGVGPIPCDAGCDGDTPICDAESETCVECLAAEDCGELPFCHPDTRECVECLESSDCDGQVCHASECVECVDATQCPGQYCNQAENVCVDCLENSACTEPDASTCVEGSCSACETNDDCQHLFNRSMCIEGQCLGCTATDYEACGQTEEGQLVCDTLAGICSGEVEGSAALCEPCVSDAHCGSGQLCARETFGESELGYRCFWVLGGKDAPVSCEVASPYTRLRESVTSIDGATGDICVHNLTTCKAYADYLDRLSDCSSGEEGEDALCGEAEQSDGLCRLDEESYGCTVPCEADADCQSTCNTDSEPSFCAL